jgi:hypothetical protein
MTEGDEDVASQAAAAAAAAQAVEAARTLLYCERFVEFLVDLLSQVSLHHVLHLAASRTSVSQL